MTAMSFGKRGTAAPPPLVPRPAGTMQAVSSRPSRMPFLSLGIFALLAIVFAVELRHGSQPGFAAPLGAQIALGGVGGKLVFADGQWWRVFTAPLLHGSLEHLLSNAFALLLAGWMLEPLIGRAWFAAIFATGAVAGSIGSLAMNPDIVVSVGASGAIMALLAAVLVCSFHYSAEEKGKRLRRISLWLLVPALVPLAASNTDYGAHTGGTVAGGILGFVLQIVWPETDPRPGHERIAASIGIAGLFASLVGFVLIATQPTPDVGQNVALIPQSDMPRTATEGMARSDDLVHRFPQDPRGHFFRALSYLKVRELTEAQGELRIALSQSDTAGIAPKFRTSIRLMLSLTMSVQDHTDDARAILKPGDCAYAASDGDMQAAYNALHQRKICD